MPEVPGFSRLALIGSAGAGGRTPHDGGTAMPRYQMVYGDSEQVVRETFDDVQIEREDGWTVLFRGTHAILRVRDEHVQSLEQVEPEPH